MMFAPQLDTRPQEIENSALGPPARAQHRLSAGPNQHRLSAGPNQHRLSAGPNQHRPSGRTLATSLLLLVALILGWPSLLAAEEGSGRRRQAKVDRDDHELVPIAGRVVDKHGQGIAGLAVVLEVTRVAFSLRHFEQQSKDLLKLPTTTDANGQFRFDWTWQRHYNHFELAIGFEVNVGQHPGFEIALRRDISREVNEGDPGHLTLVIEERGYLDYLARMLAGRASEDEKKLFQEQGRPGRVDDHGDGNSAWWYFEAGKVYRLKEGVLQTVDHFKPVPPAIP